MWNGLWNLICKRCMIIGLFVLKVKVLHPLVLIIPTTNWLQDYFLIFFKVWVCFKSFQEFNIIRSQSILLHVVHVMLYIVILFNIYQYGRVSRIVQVNYVSIRLIGSWCLASEFDWKGCFVHFPTLALDNIFVILVSILINLEFEKLEHGVIVRTRVRALYVYLSVSMYVSACVISCVHI